MNFPLRVTYALTPLKAMIGYLLDIIVKSDDDLFTRLPGGKGKRFQHIINLIPDVTFGRVSA